MGQIFGEAVSPATNPAPQAKPQTKAQAAADLARTEKAARQSEEIGGAIKPKTPEGVVRIRGW